MQRFEQSAALTNDTEIPGYLPGQFVQYVADNVDHNIQTIDGKDTFHGMGIIAAVTPSLKSNRYIPILKVTTSELEDIDKSTFTSKARNHIQTSDMNHLFMY